MASTILIGCGVSVIVFGVTLFVAKSKGFRKVINKWLSRLVKSRESASTYKDDVELAAAATETTETTETTRMEQEDLELAMVTEYPVIEDGNGGRFIFVTIVRPPAKNLPAKRN